MTVSVPQKIEIRDCTTLDEFTECVKIQREVFVLPEVELSPVRHFVVTKNAGGFVIGAFDGERLAGFVLSVPAYLGGERAYYSHMTGVRGEYQSLGIGARLKWAQRERSMAEGVKFIKWTFEPVKARNAFFNLEKLGAISREYMPDFYGIDYGASAMIGSSIGLRSDRLFAEWHLESPKVAQLAAGREPAAEDEPDAVIEIMNDWHSLVKEDCSVALAEQDRIRGEFEAAFGRGLIARGFRRDAECPAYLLYAN